VPRYSKSPEAIYRYEYRMLSPRDERRPGHAASGIARSVLGEQAERRWRPRPAAAAFAPGAARCHSCSGDFRAAIQDVQDSLSTNYAEGLATLITVGSSAYVSRRPPGSRLRGWPNDVMRSRAGCVRTAPARVCRVRVLTSSRLYPAIIHHLAKPVTRI
jgi:hypothetical protein